MMLLLQGLRPQGRGKSLGYGLVILFTPKTEATTSAPFSPNSKASGNEFAVRRIIQLVKKKTFIIHDFYT